MKENLLQRQGSLQGRELKKQVAAQEAVGLCGHGGWEVFRQKYWPKWGPLHFSDIEAPLHVRSTCEHCVSTEADIVRDNMTSCMSVAWANSTCSAATWP